MSPSQTWSHRLYRRLRPILNDMGILRLARKLLPSALRRYIAIRIGLRDFDVSRATGRKLPRWATHLRADKPATLQGINLLGDLQADVGLSQATRAYVSALDAVGIAVAHTAYHYDNTQSSHRVPPNLASQAPYDVTWVDINLRSYYQAVSRLPSELFDDKYIIANWAWELSRLPAINPQNFELMHEIWTYSNFSRDAIATVSPIPVHVMPIPVVAQASAHVSRGDFDLPERRFVVLCSFDTRSSIARKNPFGVIEAFRKAFGNSRADDSPVLAIKTYGTNPMTDSMFLSELHNAVQAVGGLVIDSYMPRQTYLDLLSVCDVYISLHRSEGFGLNIAEAMALGRPVIATAYSGNVDFMTDKNSLSVEYELRAITADDHRYQPHFLDVYPVGYEWAEPSLDHASEYLAALYDTPNQYSDMGQQASQDIRQGYHPKVIGERIRQQLLSDT